MTIRPIFAWYDLWVGIYVDRKALAFVPLSVADAGALHLVQRGKGGAEPETRKRNVGAG